MQKISDRFGPSASMKPSYLYPGFRHAGALPSIDKQRWLQGRMLKRISPLRLLVVGSGYGEELDSLLGWLPPADALSISVIDLADVHTDVMSQPRIRSRAHAVSVRQMDLLGLREMQYFGAFDCTQCGFVLHDIQPSDKDCAMRALADSICIGGYMVLSDIFVEAGDYAKEVSSLYDKFIREADAALEAGDLDDTQHGALVGNGNAVGLRRSRSDAIRGKRDFFEPIETLISRAQRSGLNLVDAVRNPHHKQLAVLLFERTSRAGEKYVV